MVGDVWWLMANHQCPIYIYIYDIYHFDQQRVVEVCNHWFLAKKHLSLSFYLSRSLSLSLSLSIYIYIRKPTYMMTIVNGAYSYDSAYSIFVNDANSRLQRARKGAMEIDVAQQIAFVRFSYSNWRLHCGAVRSALFCLHHCCCFSELSQRSGDIKKISKSNCAFKYILYQWEPLFNRRVSI